ncbi:uncharacterized protein [Penaeus vannamei]|uniref:uncharacterized protein n=1 Tax=Penaeus vannamei TaxID=6689 RepID=UPI00387F854B
MAQDRAAHTRQRRRAQRRLIATRRCVVLSAAAFAVVAVGIVVDFRSADHLQLIESAKLIYAPEMEVKGRPWSMKDIWNYVENDFLHKWATHSKLGQAHTVGIPRIRMIHTDNGTCKYHVKGRSCYGNIDFSKDTFAQVRREKDWLKPNVLHPHCLAKVPVEAMEPRYVDDAEVDVFSSVTCSMCSYPPNGHVVDIPKAVLTGETTGHFETMCVRRIVRKLTDFYLDESTRLIQFEFLVHDDASDLYILISFGFEGLVERQWWPTLRFESIYIRGMLSRGNYHGLEDDVQTWIIPALISLSSAAVAIGVLQLIRITHMSCLHCLKLILCAIAFVLGILMIHWGLQGIYDFEELLDEASKAAPKSEQQYLENLQNRSAYMRSRQTHLPIASFVKYSRFINTSNSTLPLVLLLQFLLYEDYLLGSVTSIILGMKLLTKRATNLVIYFLFVLAVLALMATMTLSECSMKFVDWLSSFFSIVDLFTSKMLLGELTDCKPKWAPVLYAIIVSLKFFFLGHFLRMCIGLGAEVEKRKRREAMQEKREHDEMKVIEELQKRPLTKENRECLVKLSECLRKTGKYYGSKKI